MFGDYRTATTGRRRYPNIAFEDELRADRMMLVRNFERFVHLLELDSYLRAVRLFVDEDTRLEDTHGFFVPDPQLTFLVPSSRGLMLGIGERIYLVTPDMKLKFEGEEAQRHLVLTSNDERIASFSAPTTNFVAPNYGDPELSDFFVWLQGGPSRPNFREWLTCDPSAPRS